MIRSREIATLWKYVEFQPGDGTRYKFAFGRMLPAYGNRSENGDLFVVGFEGLKGGSLTEFLGSPIWSCHKRITERGLKYPDQEILDDFILQELQDNLGGKRCNPWTAWALVQAFAETFPKVGTE